MEALAGITKSPRKRNSIQVAENETQLRPQQQLHTHLFQPLLHRIRRPRWKTAVAAVNAPWQPKCERNPNSGERICTATYQHLIGSQLVNYGQMVKVSSQLWSKLQKWLNKRGKIENWTGIKLLIN